MILWHRLEPPRFTRSIANASAARRRRTSTDSPPASRRALPFVNRSIAYRGCVFRRPIDSSFCSIGPVEIALVRYLHLSAARDTISGARSDSQISRPPKNPERTRLPVPHASHPVRGHGELNDRRRRDNYDHGHAAPAAPAITTTIWLRRRHIRPG